MSDKVNYYEVLGDQKTLQKTKSERFIRSEPLSGHPDKNPNNKEEAEEKFKAISEAYAVL